jgi:DNA-binding SARP family transcriptional activator/TolB-like protein
MDTPEFRLRTLGTLALETNGAGINGLASQRKRLALLAFLAVSLPDAVPREKILALFWPESDEARARNTLYQFVHGLRRTIGQGLVGDNGDLTLDPSIVGSDVVEFRRRVRAGEWDEAVALYGGPFLDGVFLRDAPELERWVATTRATLGDQFAAALEALAARAAEKGDTAGRLRWWRRRAELDPLGARIARNYMEALAVAGDREAAIRHARAYEALVQSELGAPADPSVSTLAREISKREISSAPLPEPTILVDAARPVFDDASESVASPVATPKPSRRPPLRWIRRSWRAAAGVGLAMALVLGIPSSARPRRSSDLVVVTPFDNLTGDSVSTLLGLVVANSLTRSLAATGRISVGDFQTTLKMLTPSLSSESAAALMLRNSGIGWLVRGTIARHGDSIIVTPRILRGPSATVAVAIEPVVGRRQDEAALLEAVRQRVVGAVAALHDASPTLWESRASTLPTYDAELEYTLGLEAAARGNDSVARDHLWRSARLDTTFYAAPFALWNLGVTLPDSVMRSLNARRSRLSAPEQLDLEMINALERDDIEGVYRTAEQRVALTPEEPLALLSLEFAAYTSKRYARSIEALHAVRQFPAWQSGVRIRDINAHHMLGDFKGALAEARRGASSESDTWMYCSKVMEQFAALGNVAAADSVRGLCDALTDAPVDPGQSSFALGTELLAHGFDAAARPILSRCIALRAEFVSTHPDGNGRRARLTSECHFQRGDWKQAYAELPRDLDTYMNGDKARMMLGIAAAHVGDTTTAIAMLAWAKEHEAKDADQLWYEAGILEALGRRDDAIATLRIAVTRGSTAIMTHINNVRAFLPLYGDARFKALIAPR